MHAERTPNPDSVKWVLGRRIVPAGASAHFSSPPPESVSPLAARLFAIDGVVGVFLAADFATVTKREDVEWTDLAQPILDALRAQLDGGGEVLGPDFEVAPDDARDGELARRIRRVLDEEIRPSVALDGGDVAFAGFREGVVELEMRGSCHGCPSSTATLKVAIESRLRDAIPEVQEVVAVSTA